MNPEEWLVDPATNKVHGGARYPLVVYTRNSRAGSEAAMKNPKETRPYIAQKWAQGALAAEKAHNRFTVAQDTATIGPAYIAQSAPDGGTAEVWFPQTEVMQVDRSCGAARITHRKWMQLCKLFKNSVLK